MFGRQDEILADMSRDYSANLITISASPAPSHQPPPTLRQIWLCRGETDYVVKCDLIHRRQ